MSKEGSKNCASKIRDTLRDCDQNRGCHHIAMSTSTYIQQEASPENETVTECSATADRTSIAERSTAVVQCCDCGRQLQSTNVSEVVCPHCNIVIEDSPPSTRGVPQYSTEDMRTRSRTGGTVTDLRSDGGVGVGVRWNSYRDGNGALLSAEKRRLFRETHWKKGRTNEEKKLDYGYGEIRRMGDRLGIPKPERKQAGRLLKRCMKEDLIRGMSVDGFATACLLVAVRNNNKCNNILLSEFMEFSRASNGQFRNARGAIEMFLEDVSIPAMNPVNLVPRVGSELDASAEVEQVAKKLITAYNDSDHGHSFCPRTVAGAAFHAAYDIVDADNRRSLSIVAGIVDVHTTTISERKKALVSFYDTR